MMEHEDITHQVCKWCGLTRIEHKYAGCWKFEPKGGRSKLYILAWNLVWALACVVGLLIWLRLVRG